MIFNIHGHVILIELTFVFPAAPVIDYTASMKRYSSLRSYIATLVLSVSPSGGLILINL